MWSYYNLIGQFQFQCEIIVTILFNQRTIHWSYHAPDIHTAMHSEHATHTSHLYATSAKINLPNNRIYAINKRDYEEPNWDIAKMQRKWKQITGDVYTIHCTLHRWFVLYSQFSGLAYVVFLTHARTHSFPSKSAMLVSVVEQMMHKQNRNLTDFV